MNNAITKPQDILNSLKIKAFSSKELAEASEYIESVEELADQCEIEVVYSFDKTENLTDGYGISVLPMKGRFETMVNNNKITKVYTKGICVGTVPDFEIILKSKSGLEWLHKLSYTKMINMIRSAANKDVTEITSIPNKLIDFTSTNRAGGMKGFDHCAVAFLGALQKKTPKLGFLKKSTFGQVLASKAFAEQQLKDVPQATWINVINLMIKFCESQDIDAGVMIDWLDSRDAAVLEKIEVDTSGLDALFGTIEVAKDTPEIDKNKPEAA